MHRASDELKDWEGNSIDWKFEINETTGTVYTAIDQFEKQFGFKFQAWIYNDNSHKIGTISITLQCGDLLDVHSESEIHSFQRQYWVCSKHNIHINYGSQ